MKKSKKKGFRPGYDRATQFQLHTLMLPGTILMLMFSVVPLFGLLLAFKNYKVIEGIKGVFTSPWYGFQNFKITRARFKSVVQTVTYMPHFISWVVFGSIVITLLSGDGGLFNQILLKLGVIKTPIVFMAQPRYFWAIAILSNLVKELGWSTILYTAAISGVDQELYEAADLDGASRIQKMRYVTLPSIRGTIVIMIIFAVAGIMNNNFDQIFVLQNPFNIERSEVIDTYIYKVGMQQLQCGMAAAVNIFKSILAIILLGMANFVSNKLTDNGLF